MQKLLSETIETELQEKQLLFLEGEPAQGLYYLVRGQVRIFKSGSRGKEQNLHLVEPDTSFNDVPALDGGVNPASAQALAPSTVLTIPTPLFQELFEMEPVIARTLAHHYAARLRQMTSLVADISLKHVTSRIAKILLSHTVQTPFSGEEIKKEVTTQLTQQQIATMAGTVRETVGRSLRSMEANGAIEAKRGYILIKDKGILASLANL